MAAVGSQRAGGRMVDRILGPMSVAHEVAPERLVDQRRRARHVLRIDTGVKMGEQDLDLLLRVDLLPRGGELTEVRASIPCDVLRRLGHAALLAWRIVDASLEGITPIMPSRGSVGHADMTLLSHIGLAMLGEGDVDYQGRRMPAADGLKAAGIEPLKPFGKDGLAILSSNAYAAGLAAIAIHDAEQLLSTSRLVYAISLEGLNGNVSPLLEDVAKLRPFPSHLSSTAALRTVLDGSYLWQADDKRILQDPLSFRTAPYLLGSFADSLSRTKALVEIQINSSDDNPGIAVGAEPKSDLPQARSGYVEGGAVLPTANFEPLPWVITFEELGIVLAHHTTASSERVLKLNNPTHTKLPRYLGTENTHHAFLVVEAPLMALATENRALAQPTSFGSRPIAGGVEDVGTNAPFVMERVRAQIDNSFTILSMELLHAAQAADLRLKEHPERKLATATKAFHDAFRQKVPFLDHDRSMTPDIAAGSAFLKEYALTN